MNINEPDEDGWTPLQWAAERGQPELVQRLMDAGADTRAGEGGTPDPEGWLAYAREQQERERQRKERAADTDACELASAAALGQTDTVRGLLAQGITPNATDEDGEPALVKAAFAGHVEIVRLLLSAGADPDMSNDDWNALSFAAANGHADVCTLLVAHGASLTRVFSGHSTALDMVVRSKSVNTVRALLDAGADPRGLSRQEWANKARRVRLENRRQFDSAMASLSAALEERSAAEDKNDPYSEWS